LSQEHRLTCVIVFGDFNAEPFEAPFGELRLRARRFFSSALWSQATPAYLYNPTWRWLCEPEMWQATQVAGYRETRPKTTHGSDTPCVFDHLMVSGYALRNGPVILEENSLQCVAVDGSTATVLNSGKMVPRKWTYASATEFNGVSDHFPITASFTIA
jgi:endonuclease/exonuclease/phosphatase family metal-dependent hydrolase